MDIVSIMTSLGFNLDYYNHLDRDKNTVSGLWNMRIFGVDFNFQIVNNTNLFIMINDMSTDLPLSNEFIDMYRNKRYEFKSRIQFYRILRALRKRLLQDLYGDLK